MIHWENNGRSDPINNKFEPKVIQLNFLLIPQGINTEIQINIFAIGYAMTGGIRLPTSVCNSNGIWEKEIFDYLEK